MGNDGGSIPTRRELVKSASRLPTTSELKATALESLSHAWTIDPISAEPLDMENAVSDWHGRLYNYETILRGLMDGDGGDAGGNGADSREITFGSTGIKSLRDVVKLKFKRYAPVGSKEEPIWACPVSLKELGPGTRAVYIVPCGHAFAEVAIKEIQEQACPECSEAFESANIIPILPTERSELDILQQRIDRLRSSGLTHSLKKDKSGGKKKRKVEEREGDGTGISVGKATEKKTAKVHKGSDISSRLGGINNAMTAALTAKVLAQQEEQSKKRKTASARY